MAEYPPLLELTEEQESNLKRHLDDILFTHDTEREAFIDDIIKYQKDYWAEPSTERKIFPFTGAANIIIPLTAIVAETVHARTMTQMFGLRQLVNGKAINPMAEPIVSPLENYLDGELKHTIKYRENIESAILELEKLGTGVASTDYCKKVKYGVKIVGDQKQVFPVVVDQGPKVYSVPLSRFMYPLTTTKIEDAPWTGELHSKSPYEVKVLENSGYLYPGTYDALEFHFMNVVGQDRYRDSQESLEHSKPTSWNERLDWVEIWLAFDYDDTNTDKEIVCHYHRDSRILMAVRDNWHFDLRHKYVTGVYIPIEHRVHGLGIAKQNRQFQMEVTTQHRQRLDNATIAGMRMLKISKMSGYGNKEPIFPGKIWLLDDLDQVDSLQFGEIYPSSFNDETMTLQYSQQRTGVNEVVLGMPQSGTPGTATSDLARVKEGKFKFDYIYDNIKIFNNKLYKHLLLQIAQYGPSNPYAFENIQGGDLVAQFLKLPPELIRDSLIIEISAAGENNNNIIDRQNWINASQMIQAYITGMIQLSQLLGNPQLTAMIAAKGMAAGTEALRQILDASDIKNVEKIAIMELLNVGNAFNPNGNQGTGGAGPAGAMGNPPQVIGQIGAGGMG